MCVLSSFVVVCLGECMCTKHLMSIVTTVTIVHTVAVEHRRLDHKHMHTQTHLHA